jgi:hypothetical protein
MNLAKQPIHHMPFRKVIVLLKSLKDRNFQITILSLAKSSQHSDSGTETNKIFLLFCCVSVCFDADKGWKYIRKLEIKRLRFRTKIHGFGRFSR